MPRRYRSSPSPSGKLLSWGRTTGRAIGSRLDGEAASAPEDAGRRRELLERRPEPYTARRARAPCLMASATPYQQEVDVLGGAAGRPSGGRSAVLGGGGAEVVRRGGGGVEPRSDRWIRAANTPRAGAADGRRAAAVRGKAPLLRAEADPAARAGAWPTAAERCTINKLQDALVGFKQRRGTNVMSGVHRENITSKLARPRNLDVWPLHLRFATTKTHRGATRRGRWRVRPVFDVGVVNSAGCWHRSHGDPPR